MSSAEPQWCQLGRRVRLAGLLLSLACLPLAAQAQALPGLELARSANGGQSYSLSLQILLLLTSLTFLPAVVLMMTCFTRIIIVLSLLRMALGTQSTPPNQVLVGLALFLSLFVMSPVLDRVYVEAYQPLAENKISVSQALEQAAEPLKGFMLKQTRQADLALFKLDELRFSGSHDPISALLLCGADKADRMMIGGQWRVIDGQIEGLDVAKLIADHRQAAKELIAG